MTEAADKSVERVLPADEPTILPGADIRRTSVHDVMPRVQRFAGAVNDPSLFRAISAPAVHWPDGGTLSRIPSVFLSGLRRLP